MALIGRYNSLQVVKHTNFGLYLDGGADGEILLPNRYIPKDIPSEDEDWLNVFVYLDSADKLIATTEKPKVQVGEFASLKVVEVNSIGVFLDWGLPKDLLLPYSEEKRQMTAGEYVVVHVYLDPESGRIVASAKLDKFLSHEHPNYYHRQRVDVLVVQRTELGFKVIVDDSHWGMIYHNEIMSDVNIGDRLTGYVKQVRDDGKVDVTLAKIEKARVDELSTSILTHLRHNNGTMPLTDKSSPEDIYKTFGCSKKDFKKALGLLYKQQVIELSPEMTRLKAKMR